jgi:arginyl-tRNA synthetase
LATKESQENPVYYVQYGYARLCSILRQAAEKGVAEIDPASADMARLVEPEELKLLKTLSTFPATLENSALELAPHKIIFYLMELAAQLHSYYNKHKVITDDLPLSRARLCLIVALQRVLKNGLSMVGLSAPEKM